MYAKYIKIMSNENKTIHDFELNLICDFFSNMERQGPGRPEATLKALSFIDNLTEKSLIADIGCGTGGHTKIREKTGNTGEERNSAIPATSFGYLLR